MKSKKKMTVALWSQKFLRWTVLAPESAKFIFVVPFFTKISLEDSEDKTNYPNKILRTHFDSQYFPWFVYILVWKPLDVQKHVQIVRKHSDLYSLISSVKFQVVSDFESLLFNTLYTCVSLCNKNGEDDDSVSKSPNYNGG